MRVLVIGCSLAATANLKNVEALEVEPQRQLQAYSGPTITSRADSEQGKSFQKGRNKSAVRRESFTQIDRTGETCRQKIRYLTSNVGPSRLGY